MWTNSKLNLSLLNVFGWTVYAYIDKQTQSKLDEMAKKEYLLNTITDQMDTEFTLKERMSQIR